MKHGNLTPGQLRRIRKRAGKSRAEIAVYLNRGEQAVYAWESGRRKIPADLELKLLELQKSLI